MSSFKKLYDDIADRKGEAETPVEYTGGNGRVDRAAMLIRSWPLPPDAALLDIGGATGNLGYVLRDLFDERYVLDIADSCRGPAEAKGNQFACGNVDETGLVFYPSECVDVVALLDVIEHVLDPQGLVNECFRVLRPGGFVLVNTPNIQYWKHLASLVIDGIFPHTSGDREVYHGGHVAFYNMHDMRVILGGAGLIDVKMNWDGLPVNPPPPIWKSLSLLPTIEMSVADLIVSARKPA